MIRITHMHTVVNDKALRELQGRLQGLRDNCATVGWHRAEGTQPKIRRASKGAFIADWRTNVASVALVHETGSYARMIPARPVHRTAYRNPRFRQDLVSLASREYKDLLRGKRADAVLHNLGIFWRSRFDLVFDGENDWPALADSTLLTRYSRGNWSEQPLVDTRQMRDTTTSKVQATSAVGKALIP
jgi:hypothetical protein